MSNKYRTIYCGCVTEENINNEIEGTGSMSNRTYEGEAINTFAKMEQSNMRKGG